ncbi:hypothetical protein ACH5RR_017324 [Cinchona calisaya]|uniref:WAT1-related protein n=1 Tax=Cinchona calisaya TaxID=153742 RepID=A0ABD3A1S3_9GENT
MKTMGATLCLGGALVIALYKGKAFHIGHHSAEQHSALKKAEPHNWTRGTIFLVCSCLSYGLWFISQAKLFKIYPHKLWATFYTCIIATVQLLAIGLCIDRSKTAWQLGWNLQLVTIFYSGALATAATFCLISWALTERGPTYPSMFNPLSLIFVAITEALFLGEAITVGSLLGMFLIIVGLYSFLWAKNKEVKGMLKTTNTIDAPEKVQPESAAVVVPAPSHPNGINHANGDSDQKEQNIDVLIRDEGISG